MEFAYGLRSIHADLMKYLILVRQQHGTLQLYLKN